MQSTFFCLRKFLKWLADNQSSSITKENICYIKHMHIQPFSMEVDWWEIWHYMDVSAMFDICRYCVFTLWGRVTLRGEVARLRTPGTSEVDESHTPSRRLLMKRLCHRMIESGSWKLQSTTYSKRYQKNLCDPPAVAILQLLRYVTLELAQFPQFTVSK